MPRALHLFNVFGATTEKPMLDYTLALGERGWDVTAGYETLESPARAGAMPLVRLERVPVEPTGDVPGQMRGSRKFLGNPHCTVAGLFDPGRTVGV
jgi:hypothetical protein